MERGNSQDSAGVEELISPQKELRETNISQKRILARSQHCFSVRHNLCLLEKNLFVINMKTPLFSMLYILPQMTN